MIRAALARLGGAIWRRLGLAPIGENTDPPEPARNCPAPTPDMVGEGKLNGLADGPPKP